jgi:hypothetical protein
MSKNITDSNVPELSRNRSKCEIDLPDAGAVLCLSYHQRDSSGSRTEQEEKAGRHASKQELGDNLVGILMQVEKVKQFGSRNRDFLLRGLPESSALALERDDHPAIDLKTMVESVMGWGELDNGRLAIAVFIKNALLIARGTSQGHELEKILRKLPGFEERLLLQDAEIEA